MARLFVSYSVHMAEKGSGFGNCVVENATIPETLGHLTDLRLGIEKLQELNGAGVVILNWQVMA